MGEQDIYALGRAVDKLIQMLDQQTREMRPLLASLEKLPEMTRDSQQATQKALSDVQRILVELRMLEVTTDLEGDTEAINTEREQLERKVVQLQEDLDRIGARYRGVLAEVDVETERQVRALDEPVLELLEKFYPRAIQTRYSGRLLPGRAAIEGQVERTEGTRSGSLTKALTQLRDSAESLLRARSSALETLQASRQRSAAPSGERLFPVAVLASPETGTDVFLFGEARTDSYAGTVKGRLPGELSKRSRWTRDAPGLKGLREELARITAQDPDPFRRKSAALLVDAIDRGDLQGLEVVP